MQAFLEGDDWFALEVAARAHHNQTDHSGEPFILHPIAVARNVYDMGRPDLVPAALLHDVVEDTHIRASDLAAMGFDPDTLRVVAAMTRRNEEVYADYIDRVCEDPDARVLKLADLKHNMDPNRESFPKLRKRYEKARTTILERMSNG